MVILIPIGVMVLGLLPRILAGNHYFSANPDSIFYALAAQRVAEGNFDQGFSLLWMSLVSWVSAPLVVAGFSPLHAVLVISLLSTVLTLILVYRLVDSFAGKKAAIFSALSLAAHPMLLNEAVTTRADTLFTFLLTALIYITVKLWSNPTHRGLQTLLPVVLLLVFLSKNAALPATGVYFLFLTIVPKLPFRIRWRVLLQCSLLIFTAWVLLSTFNYRKTGHFVHLPVFRFQNFYLANQAMHKDDGCNLYDNHNTLLGDFQSLDSNRSFPDNPNVPFRQYLNHIIRNLGLYSTGLGGFFNPLVWIFVGVGTLYLYRSAKYWHLLLLLLTGCAATTGQIGLMVAPRLFVPAIPMLCVLAGVGFSEFLKSAPRAPIFAAAALSILTSWIVGVYDSNITMLTRHGFPPIPKSGGHFVYENFGPGRRVGTIDNYSAAIESRGVWKPIPCITGNPLREYLREKRVEFLIVPPTDEGLKFQSFFSQDPMFSLEWKGETDQVFRVRSSF